MSLSQQRHYLFVESLHKPETDPVLVFFNGGPGAASIMVALAYNSPIIVKNKVTFEADFQENPHTWCNNASVLFIDNPADVGYSYAERSKDAHTSDMSFARDILTFMLAFYGDWPSLYDKPLYIVGISYGGNYAPYTTWALH